MPKYQTQNHNVYSTLNSHVTSKHKVEEITIQPRIKSGNSNNMFKKRCVYQSEGNSHIAGPLKRFVKLAYRLKERKQVTVK